MGRTETKNKYKIDFAKATAHINEDQLIESFNCIIEKYKNQITCINWEPVDELGNIIYCQNGAINHYTNHFCDKCDWTAFIDMDEYIYCETDLKNTLRQIRNNYHCGNIVLLQKKFDDRFNNIGKPVTNIQKCIEGIDTSLWAPKNICDNQILKKYTSKEDWSIHQMLLTYTDSFHCDINTLRFNHYNVNSFQLKWMEKLYHKTGFRLNGICNQLIDRLVELDQTKQQ